MSAEQINLVRKLVRIVDSTAGLASRDDITAKTWRQIDDLTRRIAALEQKRKLQQNGGGK